MECFGWSQSRITFDEDESERYREDERYCVIQTGDSTWWIQYRP